MVADSKKQPYVGTHMHECHTAGQSYSTVELVQPQLNDSIVAQWLKCLIVDMLKFDGSARLSMSEVCTRLSTVQQLGKYDTSTHLSMSKVILTWWEYDNKVKNDHIFI